MRALERVAVHVAGLVLLMSTPGCHMVFGDFEVAEQGTGGTTGEDSSCQAGQYRCTGTILQSCPDGHWKDTQDCTRSEYCVEEEGRCLVCEPGEYRCQGETLLQKCDATGNAWELDEECTGGLICDKNAKKCATCRGGSARCYDNSTGLQICNGPQTDWVTQQCGALGCVDEPDGDCDYCRDCPSEEGEWRCTNCAKVLHCVDGQWRETADCQTVESCATDKFNGGYCI